MQLKESPTESVKVDVSAAAIKHKRASWIISTWNKIQDRPELENQLIREKGRVWHFQNIESSSLG